MDNDLLRIQQEKEAIRKSTLEMTDIKDIMHKFQNMPNFQSFPKFVSKLTTWMDGFDHRVQYGAENWPNDMRFY